MFLSIIKVIIISTLSFNVPVSQASAVFSEELPDPTPSSSAPHGPFDEALKVFCRENLPDRFYQLSNLKDALFNDPNSQTQQTLKEHLKEAMGRYLENIEKISDFTVPEETTQTERLLKDIFHPTLVSLMELYGLTYQEPSDFSDDADPQQQRTPIVLSEDESSDSSQAEDSSTSSEETQYSPFASLNSSRR